MDTNVTHQETGSPSGELKVIQKTKMGGEENMAGGRGGG